MPMPRLPATHHITMERISAFQVKKNTAASAHRCRATIIKVMPQFTGWEKVLSRLSNEKSFMVNLYCNSIVLRFVENRQLLVKKIPTQCMRKGEGTGAELP